jgi:hypothetical protein
MDWPRRRHLVQAAPWAAPAPDPVNVVARSHLLVLWSSGAFDWDVLEILLWGTAVRVRGARRVDRADRGLSDSPGRDAGFHRDRGKPAMARLMLKQGTITVAGRDGLKRLWGLANFPDPVGRCLRPRQ